MRHNWIDTVFTTEESEGEVQGWECLDCGKEATEEFELLIEDCPDEQ